MQKADLSLVHEVLEPQNNQNKPPLLLMLHGYGSHEQDLFSMAPMLNQKFFIVSARAPIALPWGGFAWYDIDFGQTAGTKRSDIGQAKESVQKIKTFIGELVESYNVDGRNIWLMGFSQGCILSYSLILNYPQLFKGGVALSGYILKEIVPEHYKPELYSGLDLFISHGTQDEVLPVEWARQVPEVLKQLNIPHVYKEYPIGHGISPQCFDDLKKWLEEKGLV